MKPHPAADSTRILVVDDEASFTRMIKLNLEAAGDYHVKTVNESRLAYETARDFRPHVILLDVVMPEADGGDVAATIRSHKATRDIPIVFVSAMVSPRESQGGVYQSGGEHFLAKPVTIESVVKAVETARSQQT